MKDPKVLVFLLLFVTSMLVLSTNPSTKWRTESDLFHDEKAIITSNSNIEGIKKIIVPGISKEEFLDVCGIQWNILENDTTQYTIQKIDE